MTPLLGRNFDDPEMKARLAGFRQGLEKRGWSEGRNVSMDIRFAADSSVDQAQVLAKELIALQPDVILAQSTPVVAALQRETRAIPIVFAGLGDPIGSGLIASLPRPGGNVNVVCCTALHESAPGTKEPRCRTARGSAEVLTSGSYAWAGLGTTCRG
jgi:hypothetical protein